MYEETASVPLNTIPPAKVCQCFITMSQIQVFPHLEAILLFLFSLQILLQRRDRRCINFLLSFRIVFSLRNHLHSHPMMSMHFQKFTISPFSILNKLSHSSDRGGTGTGVFCHFTIAQ